MTISMQHRETKQLITADDRTMKVLETGGYVLK